MRLVDYLLQLKTNLDSFAGICASHAIEFPTQHLLIVWKWRIQWSIRASRHLAGKYVARFYLNFPPKFWHAERRKQQTNSHRHNNKNVRFSLPKKRWISMVNHLKRQPFAPSNAVGECFNCENNMRENMLFHFVCLIDERKQLVKGPFRTVIWNILKLDSLAF